MHVLPFFTDTKRIIHLRLLTLKANIHIGYAFIPSDFPLNSTLLTQSQQQRFTTEIANASNKRQRQFYASRRLLNHLSQHYYPSDQLNADEPLTYPYRLSGPKAELHGVNISHSDNWVAVAISGQNIDVGVDIQTLKSNWSAEKARFFCTDEQIQTGLSHPDPDQFFTQLWSQKEAHFKATQTRLFTAKTEFHNDVYSKVIDTNLFISMYGVASHTTHLKQWHFDKSDEIKVK